MKNIYLLISIIILSFTNCNSQKKLAEENTKGFYRVDSINTKGNFYLVYAERNDITYKIVSEKVYPNECNRIKISKKYNFILHSHSSRAPVINGTKIVPVSPPDVMCYDFGNNTQICTDRKNGIYDLYFAENLEGLCLIND